MPYTTRLAMQTDHNAGLLISKLGCVLRKQPDCSKGCIFFLEPIPIPFTTIYAMLTYQDAGMLILDLGCDLRTQPEVGSKKTLPRQVAMVAGLETFVTLKIL